MVEIVYLGAFLNFSAQSFYLQVWFITHFFVEMLIFLRFSIVIIVQQMALEGGKQCLFFLDGSQKDEHFGRNGTHLYVKLFFN